MKHRNMILGAVVAAVACFGVLPQILAQADVFTTSNTPEGFRALGLQTSNTFNTGVGWESLALQTTATAVTGCGAGTLVLNTADNNSAFGAAALEFNTMGTQNVALGGFALLHNDVGSQNTAVGFSAMQNAIGGSNVFNTAVGISALENTTANANVAVGDFALQSNSSGRFNTAIGAAAGQNLTTGHNNICIGQGSFGMAGESNTIRIGDALPAGAGVSQCFLGGILSHVTGTALPVVSLDPLTQQLGVFTSSARFKKDIKPMDKASESIFALKPVTFRYKNDANGLRQFGLVAEEVVKVNPDLVTLDRDGKPFSVSYAEVDVMLLNEFLKEHCKVESLEKAMAEQQKENAAMRAMLKEQAAQIQKVSAQFELNRGGAQTVLNNQ